MEGTYPLPEAQRDRFMMKVLFDYPSRQEETTIVDRMAVNPPHASAILTPADLVRLQQVADAGFVHPAIVDYAVRLVQATREPAAAGLPHLAGHIAYGASPRASLALVAAARALALLRGRSYVLPDDIADFYLDVVRHRLVLSYEALADDVSPDGLLDEIRQRVERPRLAPRQDASGQPLGPSGDEAASA
jgi:MoxR-like ATPase